MMPLVATASRVPCRPLGLKPSAAVKLEPWKLNSASTRMVSSGTAIFHQVIALLVLASILTPRKFTAVRIAIKMMATISPLVVRVPFALSHPSAQDQCPAYSIMAATSIGATVAACNHENQPNDAPAAPPNA